jgi:hypothetical protein
MPYSAMKGQLAYLKHWGMTPEQKSAEGPWYLINRW